MQALSENGFVAQAFTEISPMIDRVLKSNGFFEWCDLKTGEPKGSGDFRGEAGVLYDAIEQLRAWAEANPKALFPFANTTASRLRRLER